MDALPFKVDFILRNDTETFVLEYDSDKDYDDVVFSKLKEYDVFNKGDCFRDLDVDITYWDLFTELGSKLAEYYEETSIDCPNETKVIAQRIMEHENRPFICPDGINPCYACYPQSATIEILKNVVIKSTSRKRSVVDFVKDCGRTYFIDKKLHVARPLLDFVDSY